MNDQQFMASQVMAARQALGALVDSMPSAPTNFHQRKLAKTMAGTPREFAQACVDAIGEISIDEAIGAITRYLAEWKDGA